LAETVVIGEQPLSWEGYEAVTYQGAAVKLSDRNRIDEHRAVLEHLVDDGTVVYSVNTGYGAEAGRVIPRELIGHVQLDTLRSHAVGVGDPAPSVIVRGQMLLKAQAYAQGPAGLRHDIVAALVDALNHDVRPYVPVQGSQSASGDLIPNAHLGLALVSEGEVLVGGTRQPAAVAGLAPLELAMKEGVALTNDCSFAAALAIDAIRDARRVVERAEEVAAMSLQALRGYPEAYDERLVGCRPHPGALASATHMRELLDGSDLLRAPGRPHDPYSLRCIPQVHGAIRDALDYARTAVGIELRSIGDNPIVLAEDGIALSGGNIHGEPIAIPLDTVTIAIIELATLSQRRTHHLVNCPFAVGLPPKLTPHPEHSFGLLLLNTAAAGLVSELKSASTPASVESIGVDVMEDHVSMAAVSARQAKAAVELARTVISIELACAAQGLDFQGADSASPPTRRLHKAVRDRVAFALHDAPIDVTPLRELV
jgi:histidine ammonia-lyase